jgi:hypothetical protein
MLINIEKDQFLLLELKVWIDALISDDAENVLSFNKFDNERKQKDSKELTDEKVDQKIPENWSWA